MSWEFELGSGFGSGVERGRTVAGGKDLGSKTKVDLQIHTTFATLKSSISIRT